MNQPFRESDLMAGEEEAFDAIGIADADLDMAFFEYAGSFKDGAAFGEDTPGGVEDLAGGNPFCFNIGIGFIQYFSMHIFNYRTVQYS